MDFRLGTIIPFIGEETDTRRGVMTCPKSYCGIIHKLFMNSDPLTPGQHFVCCFFFFPLKEASRFRSSVKLYKGDQRTVKRKFPWFTDLVGFSSAIHDWADPI